MKDGEIKRKLDAGEAMEGSEYVDGNKSNIIIAAEST